MKIARGTTIRFEALGAGVDATPDSVTFRVDYPIAHRCRAQADLDGTQSGADWLADWDSAAAWPGTVFVSVIAASGSFSLIDDGDFQLTANQANPNP